MLRSDTSIRNALKRRSFRVAITFFSPSFSFSFVIVVVVVAVPRRQRIRYGFIGNLMRLYGVRVRVSASALSCDSCYKLTFYVPIFLGAGGGGKGRKSNQKTKNPHSKKFPKYESNSRNTRLRYACYTLTISEIIQLLIIILQNNNEHLRIKNYASSSFLSNYESARGRGQTVNNAMPSCNTEKYYHQI